MLRAAGKRPNPDEADRHAGWTWRSERPAASGAPIAIARRSIWYALREELAASRRYERLLQKGILHAAALREAIGFRRIAGDIRRAASCRCWRAGPRWWTDRDKALRALAQVDDDHLSELSETGRQLRCEERRRQREHRRCDFGVAAEGPLEPVERRANDRAPAVGRSGRSYANGVR